MRSVGKQKSLKRLVIIALFLFAAALLTGCAGQTSSSLSEDGDGGSVVMYFFWGDGCPHCAAAKPWIEEMNERYPDLSVRAFEVWNDAGNQLLYNKMADAYDVPEQGRGVPLFFLNGKYWIGYNESIAQVIEADVRVCISEKNCADAGTGIMPGAKTQSANPAPAASTPVSPDTSTITLPLIGSVDLKGQSLILSTALISFVDGFNPCSLWVLTMLLALTLHTGSRKKVAIIGVIFLSITAAVYGLFIAGLFTFMKIVSFVGWIQVIVALVALFFAAVNIKDYFWYKEGVSFTIADNKKPGIFQRIRKIMDASESFWGLAGATAVMAAGVSLVEFSCTAGFPVVWTNLLTSQGASVSAFILLLLLYLLIYQLDELVIFSTAVYSLKASRLEEKHGRILKLIGGMLMLTLSLVMLVNPAWMNSISSSLIVFAVAFGLTLLVLLVHRRILPSYGIWIGSEAQEKRKSPKRKLAKSTRR